jgi:hypothetical protein
LHNQCAIFSINILLFIRIIHQLFFNSLLMHLNKRQRSVTTNDDENEKRRKLQRTSLSLVEPMDTNGLV